MSIVRSRKAIALASLAAAHKMTLDDFQIVIGGNSTARYAGLASGNVQGEKKERSPARKAVTIFAPASMPDSALPTLRAASASPPHRLCCSC